MFAQDASESPPTAMPETAMAGGALALLAAADLQDHLMVASNDLERLQRLLDDASATLMGHFQTADAHMASVSMAGTHTAGAQQPARQAIAGAITALQFQDMASQLITHTLRRLRNCTDRIARDAMGDDEDGLAVVEDAPLRPNPVTQDEMDAGSIELF